MAITEAQFVDQHRRAHACALTGTPDEIQDQLEGLYVEGMIGTDEFPEISRLEIITALYTVAMATSSDLEAAFAALAPYDRVRLADAFATCAARYES